MRAWAALLAMLGGCGTIKDLGDAGPRVYGGTRSDLDFIEHGACKMPGVCCLPDLPLSFALDTAIIPVTGAFELYRLIKGDPPEK